MRHQANAGPALGKIFLSILGFVFAILLPVLDWSVFGWLHGFLPLLTFFILYRYGLHVGNRIVLTGTSLALLGALLFQLFEPILISLSFLPAGYMLAHSAIRREGPIKAGLKSSVLLGASWLIIVSIFNYLHKVSPYAVFLGSIDQGITEALAFYKQSETVTPEALTLLETTFYQMKVVLPLILPAILAGFVLLTIWFSMVVGNRMLDKIYGNPPWPEYRLWQLPERLIWVVIVGAFLALLPFQAIKIIGINLLIFLSIVYCFQGLAIFSFFLQTWKIPVFLRPFLYIIVVFQSFGTMLLLGCGLADVWLDMRKLKNSTGPLRENNK